MRAEAILFDKDGTFFDFQKTYGSWAGGVIRDYAAGDPVLAAELAEVFGYDLAAGLFLSDSPVIAGTVQEAAELALPLLPGHSLAALAEDLDRRATALRPVEVLPLAPFLDELRAGGLALGVATNDSERAARAQLASFGIEERFDYIAGYDSGFGAKPGPGMCLAFAERLGLAPRRIAMVGDSLHDLHAGRAAGMQCVAVLTGPACAGELTPFADAVLSDIGQLTRWVRTGVTPGQDSPVTRIEQPDQERPEP